MKIKTAWCWIYTFLLAANTLLLVVILYLTGPRVENTVLERRLETADAAAGMIYPIKMKGLMLYGTQTESRLNLFNNTVLFSFFGLLAVGLVSGQITHRRINRNS